MAYTVAGFFEEIGGEMESEANAGEGTGTAKQRKRIGVWILVALVIVGVGVAYYLQSRPERLVWDLSRGTDVSVIGWKPTGYFDKTFIRNGNLELDFTNTALDGTGDPAGKTNFN